MKIAPGLFGAALALVAASALQACGGDSSAAPSPSIDAAAKPAVLASRWQPIASDTWQWQLRGKLNRG